MKAYISSQIGKKQANSNKRVKKVKAAEDKVFQSFCTSYIKSSVIWNENERINRNNDIFLIIYNLLYFNKQVNLSL